MRKLSLAVAAFALGATAALAEQQFYHTTEGTPLDLDLAKEEGRDTEAVKEFLDTGVNLYVEDPEVLPEGEDLYLTMCSGCHGHYGEGKIGPGLNDAYMSYRSNETDVGLFATIFGGASGQMGPNYSTLTLDEILKVMAWVRHLYVEDPADAVWLTPEQREEFTPFDPDADGGGDSEE
ncbi:cytochrome c(L), periplasmic [Pontibaca methylaminivorans]|uniref:cytochrome c(L), periplasmic n=1 Tax=Pontibaca methylaminivorans TaxID=515897 RepID=UPI002FDB2AFE